MSTTWKLLRLSARLTKWPTSTQFTAKARRPSTVPAPYVTTPDPGSTVSTSAKNGAMICRWVLVRSKGVNAGRNTSKVMVPLLLTNSWVNDSP